MSFPKWIRSFIQNVGKTSWFRFMQDHYLLIMTQDITPKHDDTYCISLWLHLHQTCLRLLHLRITFDVTMQNWRTTHQRIETRVVLIFGNNTITNVTHSKLTFQYVSVYWIEKNVSISSIDLTIILKEISLFYLICL